MPHTELAHAKVNLALHVLGRRDDGYHELDSIVAFADVADRLTFAEAQAWRLEVTGPFAQLLPHATDNLVLKAARRFEAAYPRLRRRYAITLDKHLPIAAGIGGGSADAAACLRALARFAGVTDSKSLSAIAAGVGADVPVCLVGRTCRIRGTGERIDILADIGPSLAVLVNPGIALATADVFAKLGVRPGTQAFADLALERNDLTHAARAIVPVIAEVTAELEAQSGLRYARMSGSGATCFGIFSSAETAKAAARKIAAARPDWWVKPTTIG